VARGSWWWYVMMIDVVGGGCVEGLGGSGGCRLY